ncbi:MAG: hypothetical protein ABSF51_14550 [Verrucomicrobiota bacterium]|jgi:hypothetical protein
MIKSSVEFNEDGFRRKMLKAAENELREKLHAKGVHNVTIRAIAIQEGGVRFEFSGEDADVQKAKAALL